MNTSTFRACNYVVMFCILDWFMLSLQNFSGAEQVVVWRMRSTSHVADYFQLLCSCLFNMNCEDYSLKNTDRWNKE